MSAAGGGCITEQKDEICIFTCRICNLLNASSRGSVLKHISKQPININFELMHDGVINGY